MEYTKWKEVLKKNYHQLIFVFIAFLMMIMVSIISISFITNKKLLSASEEALYTVEANIKTNLRESEATLVGSAFTVRNMIVNQDTASEEILQYLVELSEWLLENDERVSGFNGIYGVIRGDYLDGTGWEPPADYVPQERPWYIAARESDGEIAMTVPYIDAQTQIGIISIAQELYDDDGESLGVISLDIMLTRLTEYVCSLQQSYGGYGILLDSNFDIIAHPAKELIGKPLWELPGDFADVAAEINAGTMVSGKTIRDTDDRRMILFSRELYNGWYVGMLTPSDSYYSEMYRMEAILIIMGTALMLALGLILMRLSAAKLRSEAENRHKSSFLARMSHEIRTPMNAILGMVELMLRKDLPPDAREEAAAIKHAGTNLLSIINDILDFSKIESGHMSLITADYQLASLLNDVINIIRVRITETNLVFLTDIDNSLPSVLIGDGVRLRQILLNLLSNAVKYTRKGRVSLAVSGEQTDSDTILLTFRVADTGIGIKEEDLDKLFTDFTQFDSHQNVGIEGTGLGLAIAKNLCRLMDGSITVSSKYGEGSVFTVSIPQKISNSMPITAVNTGVNSEPIGSGVSFTAPSIRILVVDDIEVNLMVVEGLLAPYEARIDLCTTGKEAVRLIKENEYDIVFMDHMMPEMDGIEVVRIVRGMKAKRFSQVPIIALTANAVSGMREMFLENGFSDYLEKPINISKLNSVMNKWISAEKRSGIDSLEKSDSGFAYAALEIEGLDTGRGLMLTGGSEKRYREVLRLFCHDAAERMDILEKTPDASNLSLFVTQVHALKSALASIGADALSEQAAFLEEVGRTGGISEAPERLDEFRTALSGLSKRIGDAISETSGVPGNGQLIDRAVLVKLKGALEKEDNRLINDLLDELANGLYDSETKDAVTKLVEHVLLYDFDDAISVINSLMGEVCDEEAQV